jgi:Fe2+ or Zn2+ uptake regulation protein
VAVRSPEELTDAFRASGLKITPQRQAVFRALHDATDHPTAEAVYARVSAEMPAISLRTVYQVLNDLTAMGEVASLDLGTGATRFDPTPTDHHHLVCTSCGAVRDLFLGDLAVEVPIDQVGGFVVGSPEITWRGLCPACQPRSQQRKGTHG